MTASAPPPGLAPRGPASRVLAWGRAHLPTRESVERSRLLRPVAHRVLAPALWRFTRRSVPRGVALGVVTGILFPFAHMVLAAVLALPCRANVPTAVGTTLVNNPVTVIPLFALAMKVGRWVLRLDRQVPGAPIHAGVQGNIGWLHWLAQGSAATAVGLLVIAAVASALSYALAALGWRLWIARKWRRRHLRSI